MVYDDFFTTTTCLQTNNLPSSWSELFTTSSAKYVDDDFPSTPFIDLTWFSTLDQPSLSTQREELDASTYHSSASQREESDASISHSSASQRQVNPSSQLRTGWNSHHAYETRFKKKVLANTALPTIDTALTSLDDNLVSSLITVQDSYPIHSGTNIPYLEHLSYAAKSNPDVLHYGSMIKDSNRSLFEQDMDREVSDLLQSKTVAIVDKSPIFSDLTILPAVWSFHCKRVPDWTVIKHKARLCPYGGKQIEGQHFWATYAPVVNWRTIHLVLILSILSNLKSCQIDYVNAFMQVPADCDIFMKIPAGFTVQNDTL
jgi:hypothetical protein